MKVTCLTRIDTSTFFVEFSLSRNLSPIKISQGLGYGACTLVWPAILVQSPSHNRASQGVCLYTSIINKRQFID